MGQEINAGVGLGRVNMVQRMLAGHCRNKNDEYAKRLHRIEGSRHAKTKQMMPN
jgi:hypothetical protein